MKFKIYKMLNYKSLFIILCFALSSSVVLHAQEQSAAGLYNDGLALLKEKKYEEGFQMMEKALEFAGDSENDQKVIQLSKKNGAIAAYNVGNAKKKSGMTEAALTWYEKGIEFNPSYAPNVAGKAIVLHDLGRSVDAIDAYIQSGDMYSEKGDAEKAGKLYNQADIIVGKLYTGDDFENATEAGEFYLSKREDADVAYYTARAYEKLENYEKALEYSNLIFEYAGDEVEDKFHMARAAAHEGLGQNTEAIEAYKQVTGDKYMERAKYKIQVLESN